MTIRPTVIRPTVVRTTVIRPTGPSAAPAAFRIALLAGLGLALAVGSGCASSASSDSSSESSGSISDSVSSPFESSSDSSGGDHAQYRSDVEDYTLAALEAAAPFDSAGFARGLARIAESHGVSDWAALDGTYRAVGAGLARGGLTAEAAVELTRGWLGDGPRVRGLVLEGWRAAARAS